MDPTGHTPFPRRRIDATLRRQADARPDHTAIHFYGAEISYATLYGRARALAGYLVDEAGVAPGDRVAIDLQNSPHFIVAFYAILIAGGAVVPLNPMYRADEVATILRDAEVRVVVAASDLLDRFDGWPGSEALRIVVAHYADDLPEHPVVATPALFDAPRPDLGTDPRLVAWATAQARPLERHASHDPDALCVLVYTSGSTGRPKGCPHTHVSVLHTAALQAEWYGFTPSSVVTAVQPLFHVAGMQGSMNAAIHAGATLLVMARWNAPAAIQLFARHGVTFWNAPPTMVVDMLSQPSFADDAFAKLAVVTGGGSAMPVAVAAALRERFGLTYVEGYGLSETMSPTHLNPVASPRAGSVGIPVHGTVATIVDPETLRPLPDGEVGEILVAGPQVIAGYWRNPEADAEAFATIDGRRMLRTGDLGTRDAEGRYAIVDRLKRMINVSGFKVWPAEVEGVLFGHEAVQQCCVVRAADPYRGETVRALVVLKPEARGRIDGEAIVAWARERLAAFKLPRRIDIVETLPLTATGKVDWRAVEAKG